MAEIRYKPEKKTTPGVKGGGDFKYHARVSERISMEPNDIWEQVGATSVVDATTAEAAVNAYFRVLFKYAEYGSIIPLGQWGRFEVSLQSEGVDDPKKLTTHHIKNKRLNFYPSPLTKKKINLLHAKKVEGSYKKYTKDQISTEVAQQLKEEDQSGKK